MLADSLEKKISRYRSNYLLRTRFAIENRDTNFITIDGKQLINFCSNDYLGLATHPQIKKAFIQGVDQYGFGSGASAMVSGYYRSHQLLEEKFAEFLNREKAILFNSGYHANVGVFSALANRDSVILSDKLCHASILDGIVLSRAKHIRYPHHDLDRVDQLLKKFENKNSLLVTESIFSMEGDLSPVHELAAISKKRRALLIVDDAHGAGVLGKHGRGICEHYGLTEQDVPCLITPLGKSFCGMGAVVSGNATTMEAVLQFSKTYRYSTALPPALVLATLAALNVVKTETWRREKLHCLIRYFVQQIKKRNLPLISADKTPIQSILIGNNEAVVKIQEAMMAQGFFVACIRPPSVPEKTARIRITLNCLHEEADIVRLIDILAESYEKFCRFGS